MDWERAGRGWGARALEWAYLLEPYARRANDVLFDRLELRRRQPGYLDVACGSGLAANTAAQRGAIVGWGLDAAEALIRIARARTPERRAFASATCRPTLRPGRRFDVVTSFNGIWKGCERRAHRVSSGACSRWSIWG